MATELQMICFQLCLNQSSSMRKSRGKWLVIFQLGNQARIFSKLHHKGFGQEIINRGAIENWRRASQEEVAWKRREGADRVPPLKLRNRVFLSLSFLECSCLNFLFSFI